MRVLGLLIVLISLVVSTTARRSSLGRHLWTITQGTHGCSVTCDIFNGKCPYPTKCTSVYWLRRQQVKCFKRCGQLLQSRGEAWCGREVDPNWSKGIGRAPSPRRLSSFIRRLDRIPYGGEPEKYRMLRRFNARRLVAIQARERRRLMACGTSMTICPMNEPARCNCKCSREYKFCYTRTTGHRCTNVRRTPKRVCNGSRCILDWGGYTPPGGASMVSGLERCKNRETACKSKCRYVKATNYPRPSY